MCLESQEVLIEGGGTSEDDDYDRCNRLGPYHRESRGGSRVPYCHAQAWRKRLMQSEMLH